MASPRHVVLNALFLAPGVSGGTETYLRGLAPALALEFPGLRMTIVTTRSGERALHGDGFGEFAELVSLPCEDGQWVRRQWAEQALLGLAVRRARAEVVHSLANLAPIHAGAPAVVTVHDVTFMLTRTFGRVTRVGMELLVKMAVRRADALIAVSAAARDQICCALGVEKERFSVVHHGYEPTRDAPATPAAELRERYGLEGRRVVLCVGAKRPHKNQELLLRALPLLEQDVAIVFAGHAEPYDLELRALAGELELGSRACLPGYVSDADLAGLWRLASCAAFPSLAEGFGMPLLDALAHRVPVACSRLAVFEEIGGELPFYFDPHDPGDAARAIREALDDEQRGARGPARAGEFTWSAAAQGTHEVYERVLSGAAR